MRLVYNVYDDENQIESKQFDNFPEALEYAKQGLITYICEEDLDCPECEERVVWTWDSTWDDEEAISNVEGEKQEIEPRVEDSDGNIEITISGPAEEVESLVDLVFDSVFDLDWDSPVEETKVEEQDFADDFGYEDEPADKDLDFDVENPFEDDLYNLERDLGEDDLEIGEPEIVADPVEEAEENQSKKLVEEAEEEIEEVDEEEIEDEAEEILTSVEEIKEIAAEAGEAIASVYEDKPMLEQEDIKEITDEVVENKLEEQSEDELSDEEPEELEEATHAQYAKPEGDRVAAYNNALKYAKKNNADYIYGYTNHSGKFFALEQPIKMSEKIGETEKEFRNKYKNCLTVYVAYRDKDFVESVELEGTDNAVVDCKVADVVTHSEDEKPVDCKGEKKPLEKPLTEEVDLVKAAAQCSRKCYDFYKAIADKAPDKELKKQGKVASKFVKDQYGLTGKAAEDLLLKGYAVWKSLNESLEHKGLTSEQLAEIDAYLRSGKDLQLEDFEEEHADFAIDIVSGELTYNSKTNDFTFYLSIYHASEDNNAENVEYHTDEEEYSFDTIEEVYDEFPGYLEDIYKWNAFKISKVEEAIQMTRDELMDKEGTDDVELINAGRPEEERVELVESEDFYQPDRELVGYVIVDIEYGAKYEPVYFKKGWEKFSRSYLESGENSCDDVWYDQIITRDLDEVELYDSVEEALKTFEDFISWHWCYCTKRSGKNSLLLNWAGQLDFDTEKPEVDKYVVKPLYHCTQSWNELDEQLKENCKIDESRLEDTENDLAESVSQEISNAYRQLSKAYGRDIEELVYGPNGFMATKYPNGLPDFRGDIIYSDKYWAEFEEWLEAQDQIKEDLEDDLTDQEFAEQLQARLKEANVNSTKTE